MRSLLAPDASSDMVRQALMDNTVDLERLYATIPGYEWHEDAELMWCRSTIPSLRHNYVFSANLPSDRVAAVVNAVIADYQPRGTPWGWLIGPHTRPVDLSERLAARGFAHVADLPGMARGLADLDSTWQLPAGITWVPVDSELLLDHWLDVHERGFAPDAAEAAPLRALNRGLGYAPPRTLYLLTWHGLPAASAALVAGASVAGLYDIAVAPDFRGNGIGAAATEALLRHARSLGYHHAILHATPMGYPLYRRLGFSEIVRFQIYIPVGD